jgi:hypothetical protein
LFLDVMFVAEAINHGPRSYVLPVRYSQC